MFRGSLDQPLVLVADDDAMTTAALRVALAAEGAQVVVCKRAATAVESIEFHRPSALVVDPAFDGDRGWDVIRASAERGRPPLLALDRDGAETARVAFAAGADDVVAKPIHAPTVAARVAALMRRSSPEARSARIHRHNGLVLDANAHEARIDGLPLPLTAQQFAILLALMEAGGATLARSHLLSRIEAFDDEPPSERAVDLHMSRLRKRLGDDVREPRFIEAVYGVGYRLAPARAAGHEINARAEELLDAVPDAILVVDQKLQVRYANVMTGRLLGLAPSTLVGRTCAEVLACQDCDGASITGSRCFGRAVFGGEGGVLRDVPATVGTHDGRIGVTFSYGRMTHAYGEGSLLTIVLRPRAADIS